jgi:hypothetical protein
MGKKSVPIAALNIPRKRVLTTKDNDIDVWPAAGSFNTIIAGSGKENTLWGGYVYKRQTITQSAHKYRRSKNWVRTRIDSAQRKHLRPTPH